MGKQMTLRSVAAVDDAIAQIGANRRRVAQLEGELSMKMAKLKTEYEAAAAPLRELEQELAGAVQRYCEANRARLLDGDARTVKFAAGEVGWRLAPPTVVVREGTVMARLVEKLRKLKLGRFIRVKEELDKRVVLADPSALDGVKEISIERAEVFSIVPFEQKLEAVTE